MGVLSHCNGSLPAIVDLIACSSVCVCCTQGINELLGLSSVLSSICSVGGPSSATGSLSLLVSSRFSSVSGIPSTGKLSTESTSISISV